MCHENWKDDLQGAPAPAERLAIANTDLPIWHYPASELRGNCILLPDIFGPSPFYHAIARRLAHNGISTTMVDLAVRFGAIADASRAEGLKRLSNLNEPQMIDDLKGAIDALGLNADRIGVMGFCIGGMIALDLAARRRDLAVVSYYGFPNGVNFPPDVPAPNRVPAPKPIDLANRIAGPILAFWGDQDYSVPGEVIENFGAAMSANDVDYRAIVYPGAGHGFLQGLVEDRNDSEAARASWDETLAFLHGCLSS